jgi:hypothetical protein
MSTKYRPIILLALRPCDKLAGMVLIWPAAAGVCGWETWAPQKVANIFFCRIHE